MAHKGRITKKTVWILILIVTGVLVFSYNAFSYDLFNYIFDAKIVTHYHQNPYIHKALDYSGDPMLSFMRWTHRTYPYGPVWLLLTVPLSFLGFGLFLPTFFLFKIASAASFLGLVYFMGKIIKKIKPQNEIFGMIFLGLNPLIIIEGLVSAHLDIVMMFLATLSLYLLIENKHLSSFLSFILSGGIKFATFFLAPVYFLYFMYSRKKKTINWDMFFFICLVLMIATVIIQSVRTNFQPWYLLEVIPFATAASKKYYIFIPTFVISLFSLLQYVPFLYLGNWDNPVPSILFKLTLGGIVISGLTVLTCSFYVKIREHANFEKT